MFVGALTASWFRPQLVQFAQTPTQLVMNTSLTQRRGRDLSVLLVLFQWSWFNLGLFWQYQTHLLVVLCCDHSFRPARHPGEFSSNVDKSWFVSTCDNLKDCGFIWLELWDEKTQTIILFRARTFHVHRILCSCMSSVIDQSLRNLRTLRDNLKLKERKPNATNCSSRRSAGLLRVLFSCLTGM